MTARVLLEVCVDDSVGLAAAAGAGADRIELCAALALGGLTPSAGLIDAARRCELPVRAMIRPCEGGFLFDAAALDVMLHDIDMVRAAGLDGVVLGATDQDGRLDMAAMALLVDRARGLGMTLHRAVDLLDDPADAIDIAVNLGIDTILSSGGAVIAPEGQARLAAMQARAAGRVTVMAGSGIDASNVGPLLSATRVTAVHASCRRAVPPDDPRTVALGFLPPTPRRTSGAMVGSLRRSIDIWSEDAGA